MKKTRNRLTRGWQPKTKSFTRKALSCSPAITLFATGRNGTDSLDYPPFPRVNGLEYLVVEIDNNMHTACGTGDKHLKTVAQALRYTDLALIVIGEGDREKPAGANPVARMSYAQGIFAVAVAVLPCKFETKRNRIAEEHITELQRYVASVLVIPGEALLKTDRNGHLATKAARVTEAQFHAVRTIAEIFDSPGAEEPTLSEVCKVLGASKRIAVSTSSSALINRARYAADHAAVSLIRHGVDLQEVPGILITIAAGRCPTADEVTEVASVVRSFSGGATSIRTFAICNERYGGELCVTLFAET